MPAVGGTCRAEAPGGAPHVDVQGVVADNSLRARKTGSSPRVRVGVNHFYSFIVK